LPSLSVGLAPDAFPAEAECERLAAAASTAPETRGAVFAALVAAVEFWPGELLVALEVAVEAEPSWAAVAAAAGAVCVVAATGADASMPTTASAMALAVDCTADAGVACVPATGLFAMDCE
jgi:hypothetical protein